MLHKVSYYQYFEIKYELHTSLTRQVNNTEEYCTYQNIRSEFVPNSLSEKWAITLQSQTNLSMFHLGIFLKTEECGKGHLICNVILYSGKYGNAH